MTKQKINDIAIALWIVAFAVNCVATLSALIFYLLFRMFVGIKK